MSDTPKPVRPLWQRVLGVRRRKDARLFKFVPTIWGTILIATIILTVGGAGFAEYSMQPDFCRSCHLMEPYYQAWHASSHKNVSCPECHFEPGLVNTLKGKWQASSQAVKYITQTYGSKPHAEIKDASCMRSGCHERRLLEGKVNWTVESSSGGKVTIKFDHKPHLEEERRGKRLRCTSCHSQIVQGQHLVVTLDSCYLCHFKGKEHGRHDESIGGCKGCHDAPKEQIRLATGNFNHKDYLDRGVTCENCHSDVLKGEGGVTKQRCWTCHNLESQVARFNDPKFLHQQHVTEHKVDCTNCHQQIEHNLTAGAPKEPATGTPSGTHAMMNGGDCSTCHLQTHGGPAELYRGVGGRGVPEMPSPMFRAQVDCIACHKAMRNSSEAATVIGQTFVAVQDSCNYCHATKYEGVLDEWRKVIKEKSALAQAVYDGARQTVASAHLSPSDKLGADRLLDDAVHNLRLVELGHGVHNVNYATALLSVSTQYSQQAVKIAGGAP